MTRHSRNATAGTAYTYHERKKDTQQSGYGSKATRLGKDSVKGFDCCCLTLQPCRNAVVTSDGYLFDKEAVLEYIISQKRGIARQLKEFEKQKQKERSEEDEEKRLLHEGKVKKFLRTESGPSNTSSVSEPVPSSSKSSVSNMTAGKDKQLPSFWLPSQTPQAKETTLKKPDEKVRCPMSGKPLKLKDLIDVNFTHIKDGDSKTSLIAKTARYVCPVTNDVLGNSVPVAVLKTSGSVVTMECVEKLIKKDMLDPINGKTLTDKDIIPLQRGATGFAGSGVKLDAKKHGPAMQS